MSWSRPSSLFGIVSRSIVAALSLPHVSKRVEADRARLGRPAEEVSLTVLDPHPRGHLGRRNVFDAFEDQLTSEVAGERMNVHDDLQFRRIGFEEGSELLTDLQKRRTHSVDEWQMRKGDAHVVERKADAGRAKFFDVVEEFRARLQRTLLGDLDDDAIERNVELLAVAHQKLAKSRSLRENLRMNVQEEQP